MPAKRTSNKPALPAIVAPVAPIVADAVAPAKPDASARHALRIADRIAIRSAFATFAADVASIPVKPAGFKRKPVAESAVKTGNPSVRQCATIAYALAAQNVKLADGATFTRTFADTVGTIAADRPVSIENGASGDCVASGLLAYSGTNGDETFTIAPGAAVRITGILGTKRARAFGIMPD